METTNANTIMDIVSAVDTVWVLLGSMLVFIMQAGFAMVESGFSRTKNTANILMKNLLDFAVGSILFWVIGYGIMFGAGKYFGAFEFFGTTVYVDAAPNEMAFMIFQTMFCATAVTILSGAVAERTKFSAYLIYSVFIFAFIYPTSGHWVWNSEGWLAQIGFHDFAGSAVVHSLGGWCALIGAWMVGPRIGKYRKGKVCPIPGHNLSMAALGVFLLWFGWFGFNPGSTLGAVGQADAIAHIFMTTNLAAAMGGVTTLIIVWVKYGKPTLSLTLNGVLAGLVGITAGCDMVSPMGAAAIGIISAFAMVFAVDFIDRIVKIDDPVGAISVHGVCGTLGTILTGLFATETGLLYTGDFSFLLIQLLGAVSIMAWALITGYILFKLIDKFHGLRVSPRVEEEGLDIYEHGEAAYN
ncbi:MAG: ammonium transporter [Bacteroidales bacterium]